MPDDKKDNLGNAGANPTENPPGAGSSGSGTPDSGTKSNLSQEDLEWLNSLSPDELKEFKNIKTLYGKQAEELGDARSIIRAITPYMEEIEKMVQEGRIGKSAGTEIPNTELDQIRQDLESSREFLGDKVVNAQLKILDSFEKERKSIAEQRQRDRKILSDILNRQFSQDNPDFNTLKEEVEKTEQELASGKYNIRQIAYNLVKLGKMPELIEKAKKSAVDEALKPKVPPTLGGVPGELGNLEGQPDELGRTPEEVEMLNKAVSFQKERKDNIEGLLKK